MNFSHLENPAYAITLQILDFQNREEFVLPELATNRDFVIARDRFFGIVGTLKDLIEQTPSELTMHSIMPTIQAYMVNALNSLTSFINERNPLHVITASVALEQNVSPLFWGFLPAVRQGKSDNFAELVTTHSDFTKRSLEQIASKRDDLLYSFQTLESHGSSLSKRLDDITESASRERAEANAAVAKLEQYFTHGETIRDAKFESLLLSFQEKSKSELENQALCGAVVIQKLDTYRDQAAAIVQVVGNIGVTGNYQLIANREALQANFWRWVTVLIFGVGISIAIITFYKYLHDPVSTENAVAVLIRLFYAVVITTPALYTAKESARHRSNSDRARQTELELASIGPFIELLPEDKKTEIRSGLTPQYFGRISESHMVNSPFDPAALTTALKDLVELVKAGKG